MPTVHYVWDELEDNIMEECDDNGNVLVEYTHEPGLHGKVLSQNRGGQTSFYHYDGLGNTSALTNDSGTITDTYTNSGFGETVTTSGNTSNPFGFNGALGYYVNPETEDCSVRYRVYDPGLGRWRSRDPIWFVGGINLFQYVFANPINFADPYGLQAERCGVFGRLPPPGTIAIVRCEEGNLVPHIVNPINPRTRQPWDPCVFRCIIVHEQVHIGQFDEMCPAWCEIPCSHNLKTPAVPLDVRLEDLECPAYRAERDCLLNFLITGAPFGCDRIAIVDRIQDIDTIARGRFDCDPWPLPPTDEQINPPPPVRLPPVLEPLPPVIRRLPPVFERLPRVYEAMPAVNQQSRGKPVSRWEDVFPVLIELEQLRQLTTQYRRC